MRTSIRSTPAWAVAVNGSANSLISNPAPSRVNATSQVRQPCPFEGIHRLELLGDSVNQNDRSHLACLLSPRGLAPEAFLVAVPGRPLSHDNRPMSIDKWAPHPRYSRLPVPSTRRAAELFLPDAAHSFLYTAMTAPATGGCLSALGDEPGLLLDPNSADATQRAFRDALPTGMVSDEAKLFVSLIGHGFFDGTSSTSSYPIAATTPASIPGESAQAHRHSSRRAADAGKRARRPGPPGARCAAGAIRGEAAQTGSAAPLVELASVKWRLEVLTASDQREAAGGCFTKTLTQIVSGGMEGVLEPTLRCALIRSKLNEECPHQRPTHAESWNADDALFLARNIALSAKVGPVGRYKVLRGDRPPHRKLSTIAGLEGRRRRHRCAS